MLAIFYMSSPYLNFYLNKILNSLESLSMRLEGIKLFF